MKNILKIIDFLIIIFKICMILILINDYRKIIADTIKVIDLHFMIPYICYAVINILRLAFKKIYAILLVEIIFNLFFIFTLGKNHILFLVLTIISLIIVYFLKTKYHAEKPNNTFDE